MDPCSHILKAIGPPLFVRYASTCGQNLLNILRALCKHRLIVPSYGIYVFVRPILSMDIHACMPFRSSISIPPSWPRLLKYSRRQAKHTQLKASIAWLCVFVRPILYMDIHACTSFKVFYNPIVVHFIMFHESTYPYRVVSWAIIIVSWPYGSTSGVGPPREAGGGSIN